MGRKTRKTGARIAAAAGAALAAGAANAAVCIDGGEGICGRVWDDIDMDGIQDAGETGLQGLNVYLLRSSDLSQLDSTLTDGSGLYSFQFNYSNDFSANTDFRIEFELKSGYVFSPQNQGSDDIVDSDADEVTGRTETIQFTFGNANEVFEFVDAGMYLDAQVPIPAAVWLFGSGLLGLMGIARRKRKPL